MTGKHNRLLDAKRINVVQPNAFAKIAGYWSLYYIGIAIRTNGK